MTRAKKPSMVTANTRDLALYSAMVVRNAMEDFHCQHLSNGPMTKAKGGGSRFRTGES